MPAISAIQVRKGNILVYNKELYRVMVMHHHTPGNLRAIVRITMKGLNSGTKIEERFRPSDMLEKATLDVANLQYLYHQGDHYVFMNTETYEQLELDEETVGEAMLYIVENATVNALMHGMNVVGIDLPPKVDLRVVETTPYMKGATVSNAPKPAKLETGLAIQIPSFIEQGELVRIDTETGNYIERAK
ncbi:MAG: elongation factor P [Deltaproteobacteria bacterium]|nr:elongation factor P [Deltaproteobacteria bacterium]